MSTTSLTIDISRSLLRETYDFLSQKLPKENLSRDAEVTREQLVIVLQRDFPCLVTSGDGSVGSASGENASAWRTDAAPPHLSPDDIDDPIQTGKLTKLQKGLKLPKFAKRTEPQLERMLKLLRKRERWCVLTEELLYIYHDRQSKAPKEVVHVKDYEIRYPSLLSESELSFCLACAGKTSYQFGLHTPQEFESWLLALEKATGNCRVEIERYASREDLLELEPTFKHFTSMDGAGMAHGEAGVQEKSTTPANRRESCVSDEDLYFEPEKVVDLPGRPAAPRTSVTPVTRNLTLNLNVQSRALPQIPPPQRTSTPQKTPPPPPLPLSSEQVEDFYSNEEEVPQLTYDVPSECSLPTPAERPKPAPTTNKTTAPISGKYDSPVSIFLPPLATPPEGETYDTPTLVTLISEETYDTPTLVTPINEENYDTALMTPTSEENYDTPLFVTSFTQENYDIPASLPRPATTRQNPTDAYDVPASTPPVPASTPPGRVPKVPLPTVKQQQSQPTPERLPVVPPRPDKPVRSIDYDNVYLVVWNCKAENKDELNLTRGDVVTKLSEKYDNDGWWICSMNDKVGIVPRNYLAKAYELITG